jgi:ribonuclease G
VSEEILVNVTPMETRVAVVENGATQDLYIERAASRGIVGNIYRGRVRRVLPGMQAAFIDIGLERNSFIHVADLWQAGRDRTERIAEYLQEGQPLTVQVTKDPLGSKGARLTTQLSISSRYLVYLPQAEHVGISQRIEEPTERERLQAAFATARASVPGLETGGGYILRTAAEGVAAEELAADLRYLARLWQTLLPRVNSDGDPALLYADLPLQLRTVRDLARADVERIRIDSAESFAALQAFCHDYMPEIAGRIEHYAGERPLFDLHGVEDDLARALSRRVPLKSGGHLVIDQTEAMTTIDVNTGSYIGRRSHEETVFKTNLEAATTLARQLRLRNLGGIIIIDFIDMQDSEHRRQVQRTLEKAMLRDPARNRITGVSELGLVEMTRKRTRESLEQVLCETCGVCGGRGVLKTAETVCYEIFRDILRDARAYESARLLVLAAQAVVDRLLDEESANVADLEAFTGKTISFRVEPEYSQEQFDIVLL